MYKIHFKDYGNTNTAYCYIRFNGRNPINQSHVATLCMHFSSIDNKLLSVSVLEYSLATYPELIKAIKETLRPLLEGAHKSNVENIISTFMIIYTDVK